MNSKAKMIVAATYQLETKTKEIDAILFELFDEIESSSEDKQVLFTHINDILFEIRLLRMKVKEL